MPVEEDEGNRNFRDGKYLARVVGTRVSRSGRVPWTKTRRSGCGKGQRPGITAHRFVVGTNADGESAMRVRTRCVRGCGGVPSAWVYGTCTA